MLADIQNLYHRPALSPPAPPPLPKLTASHSEDENTGVPSKQQRKTANAKTAALKAELKALLAQPLVARGVSTRYITSGVRSIADDFVAGECTWLPLFLPSPWLLEC